LFYSQKIILLIFNCEFQYNNTIWIISPRTLLSCNFLTHNNMLQVLTYIYCFVCKIIGMQPEFSIRLSSIRWPSGYFIICRTMFFTFLLLISSIFRVKWKIWRFNYGVVYLFSLFRQFFLWRIEDIVLWYNKYAIGHRYLYVYQYNYRLALFLNYQSAYDSLNI